MKKILMLLMAVVAVVSYVFTTQRKEAPKALTRFVRYPTGMLDTIQYESKQWVLPAKALIYTHRVIKRKEIPVLYCCTALVAMRRVAERCCPQVILDNLYAEKKLEPMIV
jgi:hypothetical protein